MIHIKYRNKWEKQERLMSFTNNENWKMWNKNNPYIKILDYCENHSENPFTVWKKTPDWYIESPFSNVVSPQRIQWTRTNETDGTYTIRANITSDSTQWLS